MQNLVRGNDGPLFLGEGEQARLTNLDQGAMILPFWVADRDGKAVIRKQARQPAHRDFPRDETKLDAPAVHPPLEEGTVILRHLAFHPLEPRIPFLGRCGRPAGTCRKNGARPVH